MLASVGWVGDPTKHWLRVVKLLTTAPLHSGAGTADGGQGAIHDALGRERPVTPGLLPPGQA